MGLVAVLALGVFVWAIATGRIGRENGREAMALAIGAAGLAILARGKAIAGVALIATGLALWPWNRRRASSATMSVNDARALLGVPPDADAETIRAAHRRLIAQTHPDRGGTEALARQINLARDMALSAIITKDERESV